MWALFHTKAQRDEVIERYGARPRDARAASGTRRLAENGAYLIQLSPYSSWRRIHSCQPSPSSRPFGARSSNP